MEPVRAPLRPSARAVGVGRARERAGNEPTFPAPVPVPKLWGLGARPERKSSGSAKSCKVIKVGISKYHLYVPASGKSRGHRSRPAPLACMCFLLYRAGFGIPNARRFLSNFHMQVCLFVLLSVVYCCVMSLASLIGRPAEDRFSQARRRQKRTSFR